MLPKQYTTLPYDPLMPTQAITLLEQLEETLADDARIDDLTTEDLTNVLKANESLIFWTALLTLYFEATSGR